MQAATMQDERPRGRYTMADLEARSRKLSAGERDRRLARLAEKWGARLVAGGRVIREGGAR